MVRTKRTWLFVAQLALVAPVALMPLLIPYADACFRMSAITVATALVLGEVWQRWPRVRCEDVRADTTGIYLGGRLAAARKAIRTALVIRDRELDDAATARLRVAAEACAAPRVRVALEAAAAVEDGTGVTAALDAFDAFNADTDGPPQERVGIGR